MADNEELTKYIEQIISATEQGSMDWEKANPTTYVWITPDAKLQGRIVLQRIDKNELTREGMRRNKYFVLEAFDEYQKLQISISGYLIKPINQTLGRLFDTVASANLNKGLSFLKTIVPPTK